jgi:hypothetical protein
MKKLPTKKIGEGILCHKNEIVLREEPGDLAWAFDPLAALSDDMTLAERRKDKPQKRKGL